MRNNKLFYGWWIVCALFLIQAYAAGTIGYGFTALIEPLVNEFSWSYVQVSFAASIRGVEAGFLAPVVGLLIDRWGPRKLLIIGGIFYALALLLFSRITALWQFYGCFVLIAAGMSTLSGVLPMTVVGYWFRRKVAIATGIAASGVVLAGLLIPLITRVIDIFGWRASVLAFGLGALVVILPLSFIVRHKPEQHGYSPDGDSEVNPVHGKDETLNRSTEDIIEVKQAVKSSSFWLISIAFLTNVLAVSGVITHFMPFSSTVNISRSVSSFFAGLIPVMSILGRLGFGWVGDRFGKKTVAIICFVLVGLPIILLEFVSTLGIGLLVPALVLFGIGYGGSVIIHPVLLREYFGRAKLGTILGFSMGVTMIGWLLGAPLVGWIYDMFSSYQFAWLAVICILIAGTISLIATQPAHVVRQKIVSQTSRI